MSELIEIIDSLEVKFLKLTQKLENLRESNRKLSNDLEQAQILLENQDKAYQELLSKYESLRLANSLLGSDDNKRDTKLKINSIIREIDLCIAQLSK